jgi:hypothetical protein
MLDVSTKKRICKNDGIYKNYGNAEREKMIIW